jgi:predicted RNase H-like nuclease (RuvC/YqgF family)
MARPSIMDRALRDSLESILVDLSPEQVPIAYLEYAVVELSDGSIRVHDSKSYKKLINSVVKNSENGPKIIGAKMMFNLTDAKLDIKKLTKKLFAEYALVKPKTTTAKSKTKASAAKLATKNKTNPTSKQKK